MQLKALLTGLIATPVVKEATIVAATEVVAKGFVDSIEHMLDRTAYAIAKKMVEQERKQENT